MAVAKKKETSKAPSKKNAEAPSQFLFGFKDKKDVIKINPVYETVGEFDPGRKYAKAKHNGKWGIISVDGKWMCEPQFELIGKVFESHFTFRVANKWGLCEMNGKEVAPPKFDEIVSVGTAVFTVRVDKSFVILDFKMKEIKVGFDKAFSWNDGFSVVVKDHAGGMINEKGEWLLSPSEDPIYDFSEGLAAFDKDGATGYYDVSGKVAIKPQFEAAFDFSEGLARVRKEDLYGYIDKSGKIVIPCDWEDPTQIRFSGNSEEMTRFKSGYAMVAREEEGRLVAGYIDKKGKWHSPESLPPFARETRDLLSFRIDNPEWQAHQESMELGPEFENKLAKYKEKLLAALEKDEAGAMKIAKEILAHSFDKKARRLKLTIYDGQDYGLTIHEVGADGRELENFDESNVKERNPLKNVAKLAEKGVMDEPKTAKGIKALNEFYGTCTMLVLEWFADIWKKSGGAKQDLPVYIQNENEELILDIKTKKKVSPKELSKL